MAFREVTSLDADLTVSIGGVNKKTGKKNPNRVEGYYLGKRQVADKKKKSGVSYIYFFQTPNGNVGVWGKTDMDRKMGSATLGAMTFIEFDKMQPTPNGDMYKYRVGVDVDNTIEVTELPEGRVEEEQGYTAESRGTLETDEDTTDDEDEDTSVQASALERKRRLEALLGGKGKTAK